MKFRRLAVYGAAIATMIGVAVPMASATTTLTPDSICSVLNATPFPSDFDQYTPYSIGTYSAPQYYGGLDEQVIGANTQNSGLTCLQAAKLALRLGQDGFEELAIDYNGQSVTGQRYWVIETETDYSQAGLTALLSRTRLWSIIYGVPTYQATKYMAECYCY